MDESDAELFEKHAEALTRFATGIVGPSEAQDVVSGAFIRCVISRGWPKVSNRRAYLYRAVLNEARGSRRSAARRERRERAGARQEAVVAEVVRAEVVDAIKRLSLRQRAVVILTYWNDLDPTGIAEVLGISEGAVRRHLARARAKLREVLGEQN